MLLCCCALVLTPPPAALLSPPAGVVVGDIGPKVGYGGVDNGFMRMDHLRVPRSHMMMRYSKVTPEGR